MYYQQLEYLGYILRQEIRHSGPYRHPVLLSYFISTLWSRSSSANFRTSSDNLSWCYRLFVCKAVVVSEVGCHNIIATLLEIQAEMDKCRTLNEELTSRAWKLERDLETMTKMYEAEVRGRRTDPATLHSRPTSATDSAPVAASASPLTPSIIKYFTKYVFN